MRTSTIKPGVLVSLKTTLSGGVNYKRMDLDPDHATEDGGRLARWETVREIADANEYEQATAARSLARSAVVKVCHVSSFGLLCPSERETQLTQAIAEANNIADVFNATAKQTRVDIYVLVGRVASDDVEAVKAISSEVRDLIDAMQQGIKLADPETIREAANKARMIAGMLSDEVSGKVADAINEARKAARDIVKRVEKAGESAAVVVAQCVTDKLAAARFAVLDLDGSGAIESVVPAGRAVDLDFTGDQLPESIGTDGTIAVSERETANV